MSVNQATLDLIKQWEGCKLTAYQDGGGVWTIGYGTTAAAGLGIKPTKGMTITQERAEELLRQGVDKFAAKVDELITAKVNQNQRGAIVSLAYNIGCGALSMSTVLRELNADNKDKAAAAFRMWNIDNGKVEKGLVNRRNAEVALFLTPVTADMHIVTSTEQAETESVLAAIFNAIVALFQRIKK
jgi:GH24 family phage-related lysozyme (muramidase)